MACIRSQTLTRDGLSMTSSRGVTFTLSRAEILAHYNTESGNATARRLATIAWAKTQIVTALGNDMIDATEIDLDIDGTQNLTRLTTGAL
jgi:hypothetical protein